MRILEEHLSSTNVLLNDLIKARGFSLKKEKPNQFLERLDTQKLYEQLLSYYFRRFLGDTLNMREVDEERMRLLTSKWGKDSLDFMQKIVDIGIAQETHPGYKANISVNDYGVIFEWFIAQFFNKTLKLETAFEAHFKNLKDGGDIDVIASDKLDLIMIECKESPPNNVPVSEIKTILERVKQIDPDIFILIIDTTLSIERNIIDNIKWIAHTTPIRLREGVYRFDDNNFIVTAKRELLKNVSYAIKEARKK
jgi:hypothetical protein